MLLNLNVIGKLGRYERLSSGVPDGQCSARAHHLNVIHVNHSRGAQLLRRPRCREAGTVVTTGEFAGSRGEAWLVR
jgi:hypothetical protein